MFEAGFSFADAFAGIGGFCAALTGKGGACIWAAEVDPFAAAVYERNWGHRPTRDIVPQAPEDGPVTVPAHDVFAAGFPCQPFSKSGFQRGVQETRGTLFRNILRVLEEHRPPLVILENVRNLAGPRQRDTFNTIILALRQVGLASRCARREATSGRSTHSPVLDMRAARSVRRCSRPTASPRLTGPMTGWEGWEGWRAG